MHLRRMKALSFLATLKVVSRKTWKQTTTIDILAALKDGDSYGAQALIA